MEKEKYLSVIDYANTHIQSFKVLPLNELDMAIFSILSYFNFDVFPANKIKRLTIRDILDHQYLKKFLSRPAYKEEDTELVMAIAMNPRFYSILIRNFQIKNDESKQEQFGAVTFILPNKQMIISFRGTDSSLNGWKEDFNMAYMAPIPSQTDAKEYAEKRCHFYFHDIYLTGHSKGGNLALYSYLNINSHYQKRIKGVYSFDGPGFEKEYDLGLRKEIFHKFIPEESIIGMIFDDEINCTVVKSEGLLLSQHRLYNWHIQENGFEKVASLNKKASNLDYSIANWINRYPLEDREKLIETIYKMVTSSGIATSVEILNNKWKSFKTMIGEYKTLSKERKTHVKKAMGDFVKELLPKKTE